MNPELEQLMREFELEVIRGKKRDVDWLNGVCVKSVATYRKNGGTVVRKLNDLFYNRKDDWLTEFKIETDGTMDYACISHIEIDEERALREVKRLIRRRSVMF